MKSILFCAPLILSACTNIPELVTIQPENADASFGKTHPVNQSSQLTLQSIAQRVTANNPHLRAARLRVDEARGKVIQSGRLTNPTLGLGLNKSIPGSEGGMEISFSQQFPITNRLSLEKHISRKQLEIAREEILEAQNRYIAKAQLLAVDIILIRQKQKLLNDQLKALDQLADFINEAAKRGELSPLDANQTRVEAATLLASKQRLATKETNLLITLKSYIGLAPSSNLQLSGSLPAVKETTLSFSLNNHPSYRAKLHEMEWASQTIALEKARRYADIETNAFTGITREEDAPQGLENEGIVGVGVKIPLQLYDKNEGNIKAAHAAASRLTLEKSALALDLKQHVEKHLTSLRGWVSQYEQINQKLIPMAQENAKQLDTAYRNGLSPFTSLLQARSQHLELEAQKIDALTSFQKSRVRYFAAVGNPAKAF